MNVIVSNKYQSMLETLGIDVIKSINGEFEPEEIIKTFDNFYFQRMILDVTAIKGYTDIKNIQKLSIALDMNKIILLLDDSPECNAPEYLSKLVSIGIYNFTKNTDGIMYLLNNPNTYRDVAHIQQLENQVQVVEKVVERNVFGGGESTPVTTGKTRIIGIKNVTREAGSSTLVYMMKKELARNYKVLAIEVDKRDFMFFNDKEMLTTTSMELGNIIVKNNNQEVILVDVNGSSNAESLCDEVLYLIEPSTIKLNKMMLSGSKVLNDLVDKKVILNKSLLSESDVKDFESESGLKIAFNMPPLNDHENNIVSINKLLRQLGFSRQEVAE